MGNQTKDCPYCGEQILSTAQKCKFCKEFLNGGVRVQNRPSHKLGDDAGVRMLLPVGRSGLSILAGYMGIFSLALIPAPLAVLVSILAIVDILRHREKHGMGRAVFGLILGITCSILLFYNNFEILRKLLE